MFNDDDDDGIFDGPTGAGYKKSFDSDASDHYPMQKQHWGVLGRRALDKSRAKAKRQYYQELNPSWDIQEDREVRFSIPGIASGGWGGSGPEAKALRPYDGSLHEYQESEMKTSRPISRVEFLEILHRGILTKTILSRPRLNDDNVKINKKDYFKYVLDLDQTISSISLEKIWEEYKRRAAYFFTIYLPENDNKEQDLINRLRSIRDEIEQAKKLDAQDPDLSPAALAEYMETPVSPEQLEAFVGIKDELKALRNSYENQTAEARYAKQLAEQSGNPIENSLDTIGSNIAVLTETIKQQQEGLGRLIELQEQQLLPEPEPEQRELTMAERVKNAALETGTGVAAAFQEGLKISGSQQLSKKVVDVFHNKLGHHLPGAETAVGQKIEGFAIPALVHFMASAFSDKIPKADLVQRTCLRAITGEAKDSGDELLGLLLPVFSEIASIENMADIASQFADESEGELPAEASGGQSVEDMLANQLKLPEGAKVEVNIITEKKEEEK